MPGVGELDPAPAAITSAAGVVRPEKAQSNVAVTSKPITSPLAAAIGCARLKVTRLLAGSGVGSVSVSDPTTVYVVVPLGRSTSSVTDVPATSPIVLVLHDVMTPPLAGTE